MFPFAVLIYHVLCAVAPQVNQKSWEAVGSLAQLEWERAKAKLGYVLLPLP